MEKGKTLPLQPRRGRLRRCNFMFPFPPTECKWIKKLFLFATSWFGPKMWKAFLPLSNSLKMVRMAEPGPTEMGPSTETCRKHVCRRGVRGQTDLPGCLHSATARTVPCAPLRLTTTGPTASFSVLPRAWLCLGETACSADRSRPGEKSGDEFDLRGCKPLRFGQLSATI